MQSSNILNDHQDEYGKLQKTSHPNLNPKPPSPFFSPPQGKVTNPAPSLRAPDFDMRILKRPRSIALSSPPRDNSDDDFQSPPPVRSPMISLSFL
jgi:hypothetical protein